MKVLASVTALTAALAFAAPAVSAELEPKVTKSQGSNVGKASSSFTGNGAAIGGGTKGTGQTTEPGSRAEEVQGLHAAEGRGRDKADTDATDD